MSKRLGQGLVHVFHDAGHRRAYQNFLAGILDLQTETGPITFSRFLKLLVTPRLLFATFGPGTSRKVLLVSLARGLSGKKTCAICMTADWYIHPRHRMFDFVFLRLFRILSSTKRLAVLSIMPHFLKPSLQETTTDWIYDLQLWDLSDAEKGRAREQTELSERVRSLAAGRKIIVYLGKATTRKGFDELAGLAKSVSSNVLIVVGGRVPSDCSNFSDELKRQGMLVEDRLISDAELFSLYGCADYVWCKYALCNEISSGIFGRSYQLGKVAIVREGSYLDALAQHIKHPTIYNIHCELGDFEPNCRKRVLSANNRPKEVGMASHSLAIINHSLD